MQSSTIHVFSQEQKNKNNPLESITIIEYLKLEFRRQKSEVRINVNDYCYFFYIISSLSRFLSSGSCLLIHGGCSSAG